MTRIEFDWDPAKAASNLAKHGVLFEDAMSVFLDPLALSRLNEVQGGGEERWITLGQAREARLLLVVHTHIEIAQRVIRLSGIRLTVRSRARINATITFITLGCLIPK